METSILIDGKPVKFRASAAIPRLYRIKFRRDIIQDMQAVKEALDAKNGREITSRLKLSSYLRIWPILWPNMETRTPFPPPRTSG